MQLLRHCGIKFIIVINEIILNRNRILIYNLYYIKIEFYYPYHI